MQQGPRGTVLMGREESSFPHGQDDRGIWTIEALRKRGGRDS